MALSQFQIGGDLEIDPLDPEMNRKGRQKKKGAPRWVGVYSSNVRAYRWWAPTRSGSSVPILEVIYKPDSIYRYFGVSLQLYQRLVVAGSKGIWIWDNIRIRGTKYGHNFPYSSGGVSE
jgi:hypothetical protein